MKNEIQEMFEVLIDETGLDAVFHHGTDQTALRVVPGASNTEVAVDYGIALYDETHKYRYPIFTPHTSHLYRRSPSAPAYRRKPFE